MNITENLEIEETALLEDRPGNDQSRQPKPFTRLLRSKVYILIVPVLVDMVSISIFLFSQRDQPLQQLEQYKKIQKANEALAR